MNTTEWIATNMEKSGAPNLGTSNLTNIVKRQKMETEYEKANPTTEQKRQKEIDTIGKRGYEYR